MSWSAQRPFRLRRGILGLSLSVNEFTKSRTCCCLSGDKPRSLCRICCSMVISEPSGLLIIPLGGTGLRCGLAQSFSPCFWFAESGGVVLVEEEDVDDDEAGANGNGGVGDVEGRPVIAAEPDFEEVCDGAVDDAVGHVAGSTAEQKSEAGS